jgi:hypothetical protein
VYPDVAVAWGYFVLNIVPDIFPSINPRSRLFVPGSRQPDGEIIRLYKQVVEAEHCQALGGKSKLLAVFPYFCGP